MRHKDWFSLVHDKHSQTELNRVLLRNEFPMGIIITKSVSMRKPNKIIKLKSPIALKLGTNARLGKWIIVAKKKVKLFYSHKVRPTLCGGCYLILINGYLTSQLCFSIPLTRKALWKWNPLDHIVKLSFLLMIASFFLAIVSRIYQLNNSPWIWPEKYVI